jgi:hypothetical protein
MYVLRRSRLSTLSKVGSDNKVSKAKTMAAFSEAVVASIPNIVARQLSVL